MCQNTPLPSGELGFKEGKIFLFLEAEIEGEANRQGQGRKALALWKKGFFLSIGVEDD